MKRVTFAAPQELIDFCRRESVPLVIEYRDPSGRQRQVALAGDDLIKVPGLLEQPEAMAYFRRDGWFYEVVAAWTQKDGSRQ